MFAFIRVWATLTRPPNFWPLLDHWSEVESQRSPPRPIRSVNSSCCCDHRLTCCHADKAGHRQDRKLRQGPRNTRSYTYTHLSDRSQINNSLHSRLSSSRFLLRYLEHNRIAGCFIMVWTCWKRGRAEMCVCVWSKEAGQVYAADFQCLWKRRESVWETAPLDKSLFLGGGGLTADSHPSLAPLLIPLTLYCTYCEPCECVLLCLTETSAPMMPSNHALRQKYRESGGRAEADETIRDRESEREITPHNRWMT